MRECSRQYQLNSLRPRLNRRPFADDIFKCIFLNENEWISIKISLKFVAKGPINKIPALVQIMTWRRPGDKPLSEPMLISLPTHICVTRPQWVNSMGLVGNIYIGKLCIIGEYNVFSPLHCVFRSPIIAFNHIYNMIWRLYKSTPEEWYKNLALPTDRYIWGIQTTVLGSKHNWAMQPKMVFKIYEGILCSSFYVKEFDVIVKKYFPWITLSNLWPFCTLNH